MKNSFLISAIGLSFSLSAVADHCPTADQIKFTQNADNTFTPIPPEGYTLLKDNNNNFAQINNVKFDSAILISVDQQLDLKQITAKTDLGCIYTMGPVDNPLGQSFGLSKIGSKGHVYALGGGWAAIGIRDAIMCWADDSSTGCSFLLVK